MVDKMCCKYGEFIGTIDGKDYYSFPSIGSLAEDDVEENLRQLGFGYRAKYVNQAAKMVLNKGGSKWLKSLCDLPYRKTHDELVKLPGVGAKVRMVSVHALHTAVKYMSDETASIFLIWCWRCIFFNCFSFSY